MSPTACQSLPIFNQNSYDSSDIHKLHGGGISRAFRGICVISVASAELPAVQK